MKRSVFFLLLLIPYSAISQDFNTVYYNANWEMTSMKFATYYRNSGFNPATLQFDSVVVDHYMDGNIEMKGFYKNGVKDGQFIYYYPDQSVKLISNYSENSRSGIWTSYYKNGQVHQVVEYDGEKERLLGFYDEKGKEILKKMSGKFSNTFYWNPGLQTFTETPPDDGLMKYSFSGKLKDGYKNGRWLIIKYNQISTKVPNGTYIDYYTPAREYLLHYKQGDLIDAKQFLFGFIQINLDHIAMSYLFLEPEKINITESLLKEAGQMIKQNYVIKAILDNERKSFKKVELENETALKDFFEFNYSAYTKNCTDTLKLYINLKINDEGIISVESVNPRLSKGFVNEVYRVVDMISKVKNHSDSTLQIIHKIWCLDELEFKR